jgi:hypothetical protein
MSILIWSWSGNGSLPSPSLPLAPRPIPLGKVACHPLLDHSHAPPFVPPLDPPSFSIFSIVPYLGRFSSSLTSQCLLPEHVGIPLGPLPHPLHGSNASWWAGIVGTSVSQDAFVETGVCSGLGLAGGTIQTLVTPRVEHVVVHLVGLAWVDVKYINSEKKKKKIWEWSYILNCIVIILTTVYDYAYFSCFLQDT